MIQIHPIQAFQDNYIWCMVNRTNHQCAVVDPGDARPVLEFLTAQQLTLSAILVTHHHYDHTNGIEGLIQHAKVTVYGPMYESIPCKNHPVDEGSLIKLDDLGMEFKVLSIPGHTKGHIAYVSNELVFCGDTLFTAGCGKIFEGIPPQMYQSLAKLAALPENTLVYCGHEYTENNLKFAQAVEPHNRDIIERIVETKALRAKNLPTVPANMKLEKLTNPFLRSTQADVIEAASQYCGKVLSDPVEVFAVLREWKNNF